MPLPPRRIVMRLGVVLLVATSAVTPVLAAGPRIMIVYGPCSA